MKMKLQGKVQSYCLTVDDVDVVPGNCDVAFRKIENKIVCTIRENENLLYYGIAYRHPEDEFNWKTGMEIAYDRALDEKNNDADYSNYCGRVVSMTDYCGFTQGKIYNVVNGEIVDDDNDYRDLSCAISKNPPYSYAEPDPVWFVPID